MSVSVLLVVCSACRPSANDADEALAIILGDFVYVDAYGLNSGPLPVHEPSVHAVTPKVFANDTSYVFHRRQPNDDFALANETLVPRIRRAGGSIVDEPLIVQSFIGGPLFRIEFTIDNRQFVLRSVVDPTIIDRGDYTAQWAPHDYILDVHRPPAE